jgi:hypothetical protein
VICRQPIEVLRPDGVEDLVNARRNRRLHPTQVGPSHKSQPVQYGDGESPIRVQSLRAELGVAEVAMLLIMLVVSSRNGDLPACSQRATTSMPQPRDSDI